MMFTIGTPNMAIYINAGALFLSALITVGMPNVESSAQLEKHQIQQNYLLGY